MMPIKILIADDHPLMATGIKNAFQDHDDFTVVGVVKNGQEVVSFLQDNTTDIVLLDIDMPIMNGIECAKIVLSDFPDVKVAMLSMHQEKSLIKNLIQIGVKGYLLKTIPTDELLVAVQRIFNNQDYFNADVTKALLKDDAIASAITTNEISPLVETLTKREKQIIKLISQGKTNTQIGEELFISSRTVDTHRTNIMKKLSIHNVASLIRFAFKNGLST